MKDESKNPPKPTENASERYDKASRRRFLKLGGGATAGLALAQLYAPSRAYAVDTSDCIEVTTEITYSITSDATGSYHGPLEDIEEWDPDAGEEGEWVNSADASHAQYHAFVAACENAVEAGNGEVIKEVKECICDPNMSSGESWGELTETPTPPLADNPSNLAAGDVEVTGPDADGNWSATNTVGPEDPSEPAIVTITLWTGTVCPCGEGVSCLDGGKSPEPN